MNKLSVYLVLLYSLVACVETPIQEFPSVNIAERNKENKHPPPQQKSDFQNGDIIFQSSLSGQSAAIQLATHSPYSHVGIIYKDSDVFYVFEAVQPVKLTPLKEWVERGEQGHYVVKRLHNANELLTADVLTKMKAVGERFSGKNYDLYFNWSDNRIYCSELVWKIYKEALGIELGSLQYLEDFDLSHPIVKAKLKERYGDNIPLKEPVISPQAIFESDKLSTIFIK